MKRFFYLFMFTCLLFSCKDDDKNENAATTLFVDLTTLNFTSEGGSKSIRIQSNTAWTIDCPAQ